MTTLNTASSRTHRRLRQLALPLALAAISSSACADDDSAKMYTVSGFGTLGLTHSSIDKADYVSGPFQPRGTGNTAGWTPKVDSLLALQVDARLDEHWSAVVQVISSYGTKNNYEPHVEWANVKYAFSPDLSVRVGRIALPAFMVSDTRLVGYANTRVRAPLETYSLYALTNNDGFDASWSQSFGGFKNTVQAWYGRTSVDSVNPDGSVTAAISSHNMRGFSDTVEKGALTVRFGAHFSNLKFFLPANKLNYDLQTETYNLGAIYDPGNWFVQGEFTYMTRQSILPVPGASSAEKAINLLAGYRIEKFTPYAMFSRVGSPSPAIKTSRQQRTSALGVRWDVYKNIDVKAQLDHIQMGPKGTAFFTNVKPGLAGSSGNVASVVVDFIY
jgi:hypothetical protein